MPGGKGNIQGHEGNTFSSTNQPVNRRKSTKFLTDLLTKNLKGKKDIVVSGFHPETGEPIKCRIPQPTKNTIVAALLRQAAKGNIMAIREIFDRLEGKPVQAMNIAGVDGKDLFNHKSDEELKKILADIVQQLNDGQ